MLPSLRRMSQHHTATSCETLDMATEFLSCKAHRPGKDRFLASVLAHQARATPFTNDVRILKLFDLLLLLAFRISHAQLYIGRW